MRNLVLCALCLLLAACGAQQTGPVTAVIYEGARLINSGVAQDNMIIIVDKGQITGVGVKGVIQLPAGAKHVDLSGKTVIPAIVDAHAHLGWAVMKTGEVSEKTYNKANLIDHLKRVAYYGITATRNLGIDPGEAAYEVRANPEPGAAILRIAGRGMARPNAGPGRAYWRPVAYGITNEADARKAVQELAAKKVDIVKIWVDDRNGTVPKLTPDIYKHVIDEAHKLGLKVAAHIFYLEDAKELLRNGIDGFAHGVRDRDIDADFGQMMLDHPNVWMIPNLPDNVNEPADYDLMAETLPRARVKAIQDAKAKMTDKERQTAADFFGIQSRNLGKLAAGGIKIGFGTDSSDEVGWNAHTEMWDMVASGMTPAQVLRAATRTAAEIAGLVDLGTIEPGKSADFIVLDANPLEDIHNTKKISRVVVRGQELDRAAAAKQFQQP